MNKISSLLLACILPVSAFANGNVLTDSEPTQMIEGSKNNWYVVALNDSKGISKIREFHDMGANEVQQIDYVVNCANNTMAMVDFAVMTPQGRLPASAPAANMDNVSFYKPVLDHDSKIANSICGKQLAMLKTIATP
jgi:hypothetical protein